jgi:hypothetical protein
MDRSSRFGVDGDTSPEPLWEDGECVVYRVVKAAGNGARRAVLVVCACPVAPAPGSLNRLTHEYELKDTWARHGQCGRCSLGAMLMGPCWCLRIRAANRSTGAWRPDEDRKLLGPGRRYGFGSR